MLVIPDTMKSWMANHQKTVHNYFGTHQHHEQKTSKVLESGNSKNSWIINIRTFAFFNLSFSLGFLGWVSSAQTQAKP
jgi:hypothetical protein